MWPGLRAELHWQLPRKPSARRDRGTGRLLGMLCVCSVWSLAAGRSAGHSPGWVRDNTRRQRERQVSAARHRRTRRHLSAHLGDELIRHLLIAGVALALHLLADFHAEVAQAAPPARLARAAVAVVAARAAAPAGRCARARRRGGSRLGAAAGALALGGPRCAICGAAAGLQRAQRRRGGCLCWAGRAVTIRGCRT